MTKVAHLYPEQNLHQSEIASLLHISQAKVSRLLKRATARALLGGLISRYRGPVPRASP